MKLKKYPSYDTRLCAVKAILKGIDVISVARTFDTHRSTLYRWLDKYNGAKSPKGLLRKIGSGRPRLFNQLKENDLLSMILTPAIKFGFETNFWTCRRIGQVIKERFHVSVSKWTVWKRLREAGLTYQSLNESYLKPAMRNEENGNDMRFLKFFERSRKTGDIVFSG